MKTGLKAAVKVVDSSKLKTPGERRSLLREIAIHTKMEHPNVTKVYEVLQNDEQTFVIMEYIDGGDLFQSVVAKGKLRKYFLCIFFPSQPRSYLYRLKQPSQ